jgi:hypothetical protein
MFVFLGMGASNLQDLLEAHVAVISMLQSPLISYSTRVQLEAFKEELEREIAELRNTTPDGEGECPLT